MPAGQPAIYTDAISLKSKVDEYFTYILGETEERINDFGDIQIIQVRHPEPATVTGLALYLGFESRQSIYDYEKKGEYSYVIKNARMKVEAAYERNLHGTTPTGSIFALKNMGWKDRQEIAPVDPEGNALTTPLISVTTINPGVPMAANEQDIQDKDTKAKKK